ncbi:hypothetical protein AVEN_100951-1 [Araneus ventricosus]|uniref:Uncharacterized protein n=1 Tax=Araneus ventricosus TaxID=182803 RepID=A0A4Y2NRD6_ARAVE|nr:hypothetical protein AVEN_100951-1 [Araneus ventricosus]
MSVLLLVEWTDASRGSCLWIVLDPSRVRGTSLYSRGLEGGVLILLDISRVPSVAPPLQDYSPPFWKFLFQKLLKFTMRSAARVNFTKTANLLKEELKNDASDKGILRVKLIRLQEYLSNLKDYDDKIIDSLTVSATDEDALSEKMEGCYKYCDEFYVLTGIMDEKLEKNSGRTGSISAIGSVTVKERRYRLR